MVKFFLWFFFKGKKDNGKKACSVPKKLKWKKYFEQIKIFAKNSGRGYGLGF